jgi:hypothetical protein
VLKSTDGGGNWLEIGPQGQGVSTLAIDPVTPTTLYVGGSGVFKSTDGGASWRAFNTGLPPTIQVNSLVINPLTPAILYAGTAGHGVFAMHQVEFAYRTYLPLTLHGQ